ncbi:MAG: DUF6504 family protein [Chloroflexota bacterium]
MLCPLLKGEVDNLVQVTVNCYSGHDYAERPESFTWQDKAYKVEALETTWREPGQRCFRVRTSDNQRFELCYNETKDQWLLTQL